MNFFNPYQEENRSKILFIGSSLISVDWEYTSAVDFTSGSAGETSRTGVGVIEKKILGTTGNLGLLATDCYLTESLQKALATRGPLDFATSQHASTARRPRSPVL